MHVFLVLPENITTSPRNSHLVTSITPIRFNEKINEKLDATKVKKKMLHLGTNSKFRN